MDVDGDGSFVTCQSATEVECRDNEYAYMFFHNMSGTVGSSILSTGDPDLALFTGIQSYTYWSQTPHPTSAGFAMYHRFDNGGYGTATYSLVGAVWAVRDGSHPAVPALGAPWLLLLALCLGLTGGRRLRRA